MPMSVEYRLRALKIGRVPQGAQEDNFYLVTEFCAINSFDGQTPSVTIDHI